MGRDGEHRRTGFVFPLSTRINSQHQKDTAGSIFLPPANAILRTATRKVSKNVIFLRIIITSLVIIKLW